ncbi:hypothetical protein K474DRAFT_1712400 [Panus rudis PR-1116 ss-1]|nr:hypothetical protein K474DRAFT_1712400 [Panus rudis PR-1116 ss-1]
MTPAFLALSLSLTSSVLAYSMPSQAELEVHALKLAERDVDSAVVKRSRKNAFNEASVRNRVQQLGYKEHYLGDTVPVLPGTSSRDMGHASSQRYPAQGHYRTDPPPPPNQRLFPPINLRHYRTSPAAPNGATYPLAQSNQDRFRVQPPPPLAGGSARHPAQPNYENPHASQGQQCMPSTGGTVPPSVQYSSTGGTDSNRQSNGSSSSQPAPAPAHPQTPAGRTQHQHPQNLVPPRRGVF